MSSIHDHNRKAWDLRVKKKARHTASVSSEALKSPHSRVDPEGWMGGNLYQKRVLCLAAGGGVQSALFAAAGATVTVVDISSKMLDQDRREADRHGLQIKCVEASMDDLSPFADGVFELVAQPVSSCYVPDIIRVFREVARVLVPDGLYVSQHKQPVNLQAKPHQSGRGYAVAEPYYRSGPLTPIASGFLHREADTVEFLHRWEDLIGGMCRAGFVIEDLVEPRHGDATARPGSFPHRSHFIPPYVRIKARRQTPDRGEEKSNIWIS